MPNIKISQLKVLIAVVENGSFSGAAAELDCTQSRISHAIAALETRLGTRLLVRSRAGCSPTSAGLLVLAKARQVIKLAKCIATDVVDMTSHVGRVRIASVRSVATHLLPYAAEVLAEKHPRLSIEIFDGCEGYEDVPALVETGRADIGITCSSSATRLLRFPYISDPYVLVVPSETNVSRPPAWNDFLHLPLLHLNRPSEQRGVEQLRAHGWCQDPSAYLANASSILNMVARGLGYTLLPRLATLPDVLGTRIVRPPVALVREFSIVVAPAGADSPLIRTVVEACRNRQIMGSTEAWRLGAISWLDAVP